MGPVLRSSFNAAAAASILFSMPVIQECYKMVEEQKPVLFSVLRENYNNHNLRKGRIKAFTVPTHLKPCGYMTWPSIFSIKTNALPNPTVPNWVVRPTDCIKYILDTYNEDHRVYCTDLSHQDLDNHEFYILCTDGSCMICLRCRQWIMVYKIWGIHLERALKDKVKNFFAEYYIPAFFLMLSREVSTTYNFLLFLICHHVSEMLSIAVKYRGALD